MFSSRANLLTKPLQRIAVGGVLTAAAFFVSGFLELELMVSKLKNKYKRVHIKQPEYV